jgi:hypothetical protein
MDDDPPFVLILYLVLLNWVCDLCTWWKRTCEEKGYFVADLKKELIFSPGRIIRPPRGWMFQLLHSKASRGVLLGRIFGQKFGAGGDFHPAPCSAQIHRFFLAENCGPDVFTSGPPFTTKKPRVPSYGIGPESYLHPPRPQLLSRPDN